MSGCVFMSVCVVGVMAGRFLPSCCMFCRKEVAGSLRAAGGGLVGGGRAGVAA